jgi:hypothetical protein
MTEQQIIETLATKVMGWIPKKDYFVGDKRIDCFLTDEGKRIAAYQWNPLQNIADAWMIVQKMAKADPVTSHRFQEALSMYCIYDITPERICWAAWQSLNTPVTVIRRGAGK